MFRLRGLLIYLLAIYSFFAKASDSQIRDFFLCPYESIEDLGFSSFVKRYEALYEKMGYSAKTKEFLIFLYSLAAWLDLHETGFSLDTRLIADFSKDISYEGRSLNSKIVKPVFQFLESQTNDRWLARRIAFKLLYVGIIRDSLSANNFNQKSFKKAIERLWDEFPYSYNQEYFEKLVRIYKKSMKSDPLSDKILDIILSFQKDEDQTVQAGESCEEHPIGSCVICLDDVEEGQACLTNDQICCRSCIRQLIKIQIESNMDSDFDLHRIKCPIATCQKPLLYSACIKHLYETNLFSNAAIINLLKWRINTLSCDEIEGLLHCPSGDCVQTFCKEDYVVSAEIYKKITHTKDKYGRDEFLKLPTITCPTCDQEFCTSCGSPDIGNCCNKIDEIEGISRCPICSAPYEKDGGCDYLQCRVCTTPFDALTGEVWTKEYADQKKNGSHMSDAISEEKVREIVRKYKKNNDQKRRQF